MSGTDDITARVREILAHVLDVPAERIGPGFSSDEAPEWDSLTHLMLISQLESEFGVFFPSQELPQLTSLERIADAIARQAAPGG